MTAAAAAAYPGYVMVSSGTYYPEDTRPAVIDVLEKLLEERRKNRVTITIDYGNGETYSQSGYIGRTTGPKHLLILVYNSRSLGGDLISTKLVTKIVSSTVKNGYVYYDAGR